LNRQEANRVRDPSTRTARAIRRTAIRWFALASAGWVLLVPLVLVQFHLPLAITAAATAASVGILLSTVGYGLLELLGQVQLLDHERHGLREAYDRARLDALRDGLTGLGNHRAFQEELIEQVTVAQEKDRPFALLLVDVDDLKKTNDAGGHAAGDRVLKATAGIITSNLRRWDRGFRIGGDEFAIVLLDCDATSAVTTARRMLVSALEGGSGANAVEPFSLTIGVSAYPSPAADRQQLVHQADAALYWGKRHGRTDVQLFDPARHGMAEDWRSLDELAAAVSRVAADRLMTPVYQPVFDLRTGAIMGYEGLVRPTPEAGFPNVAAMFVAAESTGRTVELDLASLETVIAGAGDLAPEQYLSVNLSPRSLETDAFNPFELLALFRRYAIDPSRIVLELTEREAVEDMARLRETLAGLRRYGIRTAADDVGAGNAGLRLLTEVDFDVMKIDLSLVRAGAASGTSDAVLRALRDLAGRREQSIVAEGVETPEQLELVITLGFDAAQGYLLGRPRPAIDATAVDFASLVPGMPAPRTAARRGRQRRAASAS
jgi:diguanylate cyclase (GGDEF)-like protein